MRYKLFIILLIATGMSCLAMDGEPGVHEAAIAVPTLADATNMADDMFGSDLPNAASAQALLRLLNINSDDQDQQLLGVVNETFKQIDPSAYHIIYSKIKARGFDKHKDNRIGLLKELLVQVNEINKTQQEQNQKLAAMNKKLDKKVSDCAKVLVTGAFGLAGTIITIIWGATAC